MGRIKFVFFLFVVSCASSPRLFPVKDARTNYRASSDGGMVTAAHHLASEAGAHMLEQGGNATDAAVAASFVISVVRPQSTGLGGGGFLLAYNHSSKNVQAFDFRERAPRLASRAMYIDAQGRPIKGEYKGLSYEKPSVNGHKSVAIPGLVSGLTTLHKKFGKLPLQTVMTPAIHIAEAGFPIYKALGDELSNRSSILRIFPATEKIFFRDGLPLKEGQILIQKDLANTLRRIATSGGNEFYVGYTAELIAAEMKAGGGLMTADDLKAYRLKERRPVTQRYGDYQVFSMPPPSSGGVHLIQMLNMLEHEPKQPSYHLWAETMRRAFADRARYMGDPEFTKVPTAALISKSYGASLRSTIDDGRATDSKTLQNATIGSESPSTTHISVVDRWGNAVSTTQTINYSFGSCVVAAGTGVLLNDEMDDFVAVPGEANVFGLVGSAANEIAPGKTPLSSMTPTIVLDNNGVKLVVGSPGGPRIINAVAQVVAKVLFEKKPLLDAVHRYRIHHQWMPDQIFVEPDGLTATERSSLVDKGHQLKEITNIGDIQAIAKEDGTWVGVSDARSEGRPKGVYSLPNFER